MNRWLICAILMVGLALITFVVVHGQTRLTSTLRSAIKRSDEPGPPAPRATPPDTGPEADQ
jgi:hypothetical protein